MSQPETTPHDGNLPEPAASTDNPPAASAGPYTPPPGLRRYLRRLPALGLVAAVLAGGMSIAVPETPAQAAPKVQMCWYKGWFKEDGVWYQGLFSEPC